MEIIVTDLTRMNEDRVCLAGWAPDSGRFIRPMPFMPATLAERLGIRAGTLLQGEFHPVESPVAPHVEDCYHECMTNVGRCNEPEFLDALLAGRTASMEEGFGHPLEPGQKHFPEETPPSRSLLTLEVTPSQLTIVQDLRDQRKLRANFQDSSGQEHRFLSITDMRFHQQAETLCKAEALFRTNAFLHGRSRVLLRIGLTRLHEAPDGRKGFWMQVNGIYSFA